jgi:hypothetical protein
MVILSQSSVCFPEHYSVSCEPIVTTQPRGCLVSVRTCHANILLRKILTTNLGACNLPAVGKKNEKITCTAHGRLLACQLPIFGRARLGINPKVLQAATTAYQLSLEVRRLVISSWLLRTYLNGVVSRTYGGD